MNASVSKMVKANSILNYFMGVNFIFGLVSNVLVLLICSRKKIRSIPTFVFIWFIGFADLSQVLVVSLSSFVGELFSLNLEINSWLWCRITTIFKLSLFQWNSWLITGMTLEVYLSVRIRNFRQTYSTFGKTTVFCLFFGICLFLLNCSVMGLPDNTRNATVSEKIMLCLSPFSIKEYYAQLSMVIF